MVKNQSPKWIKNILKDNDFKLIEDAIKKVELKTSGEVVPIIVRSSIRTGHVVTLLSLLVLLMFLILDISGEQNYLLNYYYPEGSQFFSLFIFLLNIAFGIGIIFFLSRFDFIKRTLTNKDDIVSQVEQRALVEFYNNKVNKTQKATGILIFVSLLERKAIVLGDKSIAEKITQHDWQAVVDTLIQGIKNKELGRGFCEAIEKSGKLLEAHFPVTKNDQNELPNELIIKE